MNALVEIDFKNPVPIDLESQIDLRQIFDKLSEKGGVSSAVKFADWAKNKLRYYTENTDYFTDLKNDP
ncbi:MAG: hypothetical protein HRU19_03300 [Pseudobacteriovorax sp.]|nr:hypothetical protein [Pseudobacteriovorax sp.]